MFVYNISAVIRENAMVLYENKKCPVCKEVFKEDDDIVTCPVCGTPHHRECYKSLNHCANQDLHKTDFSFLKDDKSSADFESENQTADKEAEISSAEAVGKISGVNFEKDKTDKEQIDGVDISDIYDYVGVNQEKFIPKFRKNKKLSWNWGALFFGPLYMFYRKMYLDGVMFLTLKMLADYALSTAFSKEMEAAQKFFENFVNSPDISMLNSFASTKEFKIFMISNAIMLVIDIIGAVLVNWLYRRKVINSIKLFDSKIKELDIEKFEHLTDFKEGLNTAEGRKMYFKDSGGVSMLAPILLMFFTIGYTIISSMG